MQQTIYVDGDLVAALATIAIPEPTSGILLSFASLALLCRRRQARGLNPKKKILQSTTDALASVVFSIMSLYPTNDP